MTTIRLRKDNSGQVSIDFLVGITIFILAFLFLMVAIPKMFTPFQSNSDELTMVADRAATTLLEKELVYTNSAGEPLPGIIDMAKVTTLKAALIGPLSENKRKSLGLEYTDSYINGDKVYFIQVELDGYDLSPTHQVRAPNIFPDSVEIGSQNVGQSRRFVYLRDSSAAGTDPTLFYPGVRTMMVVRVWQY